jgi:hypothetical protein
VFSLIDGVAMASAPWRVDCRCSPQGWHWNAQAGMLLAATSSVSKWFPATERGFASGTIGRVAAIGAALALCSRVAETLGWRLLCAVALLAFVVGVVLGLVSQSARGALLGQRCRGGSSSRVAAGRGGRVQGTNTVGLLLVSRAMVHLSAAVPRGGVHVLHELVLRRTRDTREVSVTVAGCSPARRCTGRPWQPDRRAVSDLILARTGSRRLGWQGGARACCCRGCGSRGPADCRRDPGCGGAEPEPSSPPSRPCAYAITIDMGGRHVAPVFATMNMVGNFERCCSIVVPGRGRGTAKLGPRSDNVSGIHVTAAVFWMLLDPRGTVFGRDEKPTSEG